MENSPAVAAVDAPLVLRRSRAVLAYLVVMGVFLAGGAILLAAQGVWYALPIVAVGVIGTACQSVTWARCRTEIGPEGILNRAIRAEVLIPWQEVVRVVPMTVPGTVLVVRRGGRATRLAGMRGQRPKGVPDLDQVVDVIEARIEPSGASPPRPVPSVIVRRLRLAPARGFLLFMIALGVLAALYAVIYPVAALLAVLFLGPAGFVFVATRRALTEVGPEGIRNRALMRTVSVPWSDVTEVIVSGGSPHRTVKVVRRDGERMTLAAVRDSDLQVDGLGLEDVADVIRERSSVTEPRPTAPLPSARPLSLRPSRRPLAWIIPVAVVLAAGDTLLAGVSLPLFMIGLVLVALLLRLAFRLLRGRTEAGPHGLRNRFGLATTVVAWSDVEEFVIVPTLFGRIVRVVRPPRRRFTLASPRDGLLGRDASVDSSLAVMRALAAEDGRAPGVHALPRGVRVAWWVLLALTLVVGTVVAKPWLEPWWPTRHEATSLPPACDLPVGSIRLVPDAIARQGNGYDNRESATSYCLTSGNGAEVDLDVSLERRQLGRSGTQVAARLYAAARSSNFPDMRPVPLPGLGDEAWVATWTAAGRTSARVSVRRHNVRILVDYTGGLPAGQALAGAEAMARGALHYIPDSH